MYINTSNQERQNPGIRRCEQVSPFQSNYSWVILFENHFSFSNARFASCLTKSPCKLPVITDITFIDVALAFMRVPLIQFLKPPQWLKIHREN